MDIMNITIHINLWFDLSLCLVSFIAGGLAFNRRSGGSLH